MLEKLKELLSNWKITVTLVGGAIIVATAYGTCTVEPDLQSPPADEADVPGEAAVLEVTATDAINNVEETTNSDVEEAEAVVTE